MHSLNAVVQSEQQIPSLPQRRWPLLAWFASNGTLTVPQAAGPVAFSLIVLTLTEDTSGGATMILAMTIAQIFGPFQSPRTAAAFPLRPFCARWFAFGRQHWR